MMEASDLAEATKAKVALCEEAADALSALTKEVEARDKALEYSLTLCDQFVEGLAWSDYDMRVIASTELDLADLRALSNLRSVVAQSLSRADGDKGSEGQ